MTTTTLPRVARPHTNRPVFVDVARSEWTKLRSVRSTYLTFAAAMVAMLGVGAIVTLVFANNYSELSVADKASFSPTAVSLSGVLLAQLAIGVLGVLAVTSEYGTGMIRSTFAAVPNRRLLLAAKVTVFAGVTAVIGIVSSVVAFLIGQAILSGDAPHASFSDPGVVRSVVGAGLYLALLGIFALGIGVLLRRTAGSIATLLGLVLVLPPIVSAFGSAGDSIAKFLPSAAGQAIFNTEMRGQDSLSPWVGLAVMALYTAAVISAAAILLTRRDA